MRTEPELELALSHPTSADVAAMGALEGDLVILGVSGKMGPSLARLARRASDEAGVARSVIGVARFRDTGDRTRLERHGIDTIACDLLDHAAVGRLPRCPNVVYMAGQKFGTERDAAATWATNTYAPALAAEHFRDSRIVAFSTGNVYPLTPAPGDGPDEDGPLAPIGDYAQSALGRERVLEFFSRRYGTAMAVLRLNYAVELRYGVLRDIADRVFRRQPLDLGMGYVNVIWQRDANAVALRALAHCASPPFVLNVTGRPALAVRTLAERLGERLHIAPAFTGAESGTALLANASRCEALFGPPTVSLDQLIEWTAEWVASGGSAFGLPTHFQEREGRF